MAIRPGRTNENELFSVLLECTNVRKPRPTENLNVQCAEIEFFIENPPDVLFNSTEKETHTFAQAVHCPCRSLKLYIPTWLLSR